MRLWRLFGGALALACATGLAGAAGTAHAAGGIDRLAIVSNLGGRLTVVLFKQGVGSHLDRNPRRIVELPADAFDVEAADVAAGAVRELQRPVPIPLLLPTLDAEARQAAFGANAALPAPALRDVLRQAGATHLLLLTRHRGESRLRVADGAIGSGTLEGLGFYLDRTTPTRDGDTGAGGQGFLAPYAYLLMRLIDLNSGAVLAEQSARASSSVSGARLTTGVDPWDVLTPEEKVDTLRALIRTEVRRLVPELLVGR